MYRSEDLQKYSSRSNTDLDYKLCRFAAFLTNIVLSNPSPASFYPASPVPPCPLTVWGVRGGIDFASRRYQTPISMPEAQLLRHGKRTRKYFRVCLTTRRLMTEVFSFSIDTLYIVQNELYLNVCQRRGFDDIPDRVPLGVLNHLIHRIQLCPGFSQQPNLAPCSMTSLSLTLPPADRGWQKTCYRPTQGMSRIRPIPMYTRETSYF